jgi:protein-disulfide isomerase
VTTRCANRSEHQTRWAAHRVLSVATTVTAFAGLFAAAVLSLGHFLDLPVPCGTSGGCVTVAAHPSSKFLSVPVAYFGVVFFLVQIGLLSSSGANRPVKIIGVILAGTGSIVSAALLLYSRSVIQATCGWCMASGVAMAALFVLSVFSLRLKQIIPVLRPRVTWGFGFATALAIGVQAGQMQRAALIPPIAMERLAAIPAAVLLEPGKSIGPADAVVTVIVFADFLCPACRSELGSLLRYQQSNPNAVRVVYRHLPLAEIRGHETSKAAAALSEMAGERGQFWAFANAIHAHPGQMTRQEYLELMRTLGFEPVAVEERLGNPNDPALLSVLRDIELAEQLQIRATPTFIVQAGAAAPIATTQRGLVKVLNSPSVVSVLKRRGESSSAQ